jgi:hypothetical protein
MALGYALLALASAILLHALVRRLPRSPGSVATFLTVATVCAIALAAHLIRKNGLTPETIAAATIYAFGCELYLFLSTFSLASISSNILAELFRQPLAETDLSERYTSDRMVRLRIARMIAAGLMAEDAGNLRLTRKGMRMVRVFERLGALFGH